MIKSIGFFLGKKPKKIEGDKFYIESADVFAAIDEYHNQFRKMGYSALCKHIWDVRHKKSS